MAVTPPDSLSDRVHCLLAENTSSKCYLCGNQIISGTIHKRIQNGLDKLHRVLKLAFDQIIFSSSQRQLFAFIYMQPQKDFKVKHSVVFCRKKKHTNLQNWNVVIAMVQCCTKILTPFLTSWSAMFALCIKVLKLCNSIESSYIIAGINNFSFCSCKGIYTTILHCEQMKQSLDNAVETFKCFIIIY